jgi:hypothetical protein
LDFIRWEIGRGLLNPMVDTRPGSPYWRAAQAEVSAEAEGAADLLATPLSAEAAPEGVRAWVAAIRAPTPATWYAAHNRSLVGAMRRVLSTALQESAAEQRFIDDALRRVLLAELLVRGGVRPFLRPLARLAGDPRGPVVRAATRSRLLYPRAYPLPDDWLDRPSRRAARRVEERVLRIALDRGAVDEVAAPHLHALFGANHAANAPSHPRHVPRSP